jgi:hypothetical protein
MPPVTITRYCPTARTDTTEAVIRTDMRFREVMKCWERALPTRRTMAPTASRYPLEPSEATNVRSEVRADGRLWASLRAGGIGVVLFATGLNSIVLVFGTVS